LALEVAMVTCVTVPCRRGLALELLGRLDEALECLMVVKEQQPQHSAVAADLLRVATKLQEQRQQQQQQADEAASTLVAPAEAVIGSDGSDGGTQDDWAGQAGSFSQQQSQQQQQQQSSGALPFTGMRASIPVMQDTDSETEDSEDSSGCTGRLQHPNDGDAVQPPDEGCVQPVIQHVGSRAADVLPSCGTADVASTMPLAAPVPDVVLPAAKAAEAAAGDGVRSPEESGKRRHIPVVSEEEDEEEEEQQQQQQQQDQDGYQGATKDKIDGCGKQDAASPGTAEVAEAAAAGTAVTAAADYEEQMLQHQEMQPRKVLNRYSGNMTLDGDEEEGQPDASDAEYWSSAGFEAAAAEDGDNARAALELLTNLVRSSGLDSEVKAPSSSSGLLQRPPQQPVQTPSQPEAGGILRGVALPNGLADKALQLQVNVMLEALKRPSKKKYQDDSSRNGIATQMHRKKHQAEVDREAGNDAYRKGQLQQALKHYGAAINHCPAEAKIYANRAQVCADFA
jgi:tetratricopeptide (TPR) repeat protein